MIATPKEYCQTINKAIKKHGNAGALLALEVMDVLEEMEKKKTITAKQKNGKTYYQLKKK